MFICSSFLLMNCNDDDKSSTPDEGEETKPLVDRITLEVDEITIPAHIYNPQNYRVWFGLLGNKIIYANASNSPTDQFMVGFDITNQYFTNYPVHEEICACGFMSKLVGEGTHLYYIANEAWRLNVANNTWTELDYPNFAKENNGEAGVVYADNKIFFLGGRNATPKFKYYQTNTDTWHELPNYLYAVGTPDLVAINNRIYALGGDSSGKRFSYFENGNWVALADLPFTPQNSYSDHSVASYGNRFIFSMVNGNLFIYDSVEELWAEEPLALGITGIYVSLFSDNNYLYIAQKDYDNDFKLFKYTVNIP